MLVSGALLLVGSGLLQAQRWALVIAVVGSAVLVVDGAIGLSQQAIRLSAALALVSLLAIGLEGRQVLQWMQPMRTSGWRAAVVAIVLGLPLAAPAVGAVPDPTQATAADLDLTAELDCDAPVEVGSYQEKVTEPGIVIRVDVTWRRTSLLPSGIANSISVDNLVVWLPKAWVLMDDRLFDPDTGEQIPGSGGLGPGGPTEVEGRAWFAAIPHAELQEGRTIRFEVTLADGSTGLATVPLPAEGDVMVRYWHADAFTVERSLSCPANSSATDPRGS